MYGPFSAYSTFLFAFQIGNLKASLSLNPVSHTCALYADGIQMKEQVSQPLSGALATKLDCITVKIEFFSKHTFSECSGRKRLYVGCNVL